MSSPRRESPFIVWSNLFSPASRSRRSDLEKDSEEERSKVEAKEVPTEAGSQQRQLERTVESLESDERHDELKMRLRRTEESLRKRDAECRELKRLHDKKLADYNGKHRRMDTDMDALRKRLKEYEESLRKEATKSRELKGLHEKKTAECDVLKAKHQRMEADILRADLSESEQGKMIAELKIQKLGLSSQIETLEAKVKKAENESQLAQQQTRSSQESMAAEMKQTKQELTSIMSSYKDISDKVKEAESLAQQIESDKKKMAEELKEKFKRESQQLEKEKNDLQLHNSELQSTVKAADCDRLVCADRHEQEINELTKAQQTVHEILQADMKQLEKEKGSLKKKMCISDHDTAMMKKLVEQYTGENQQLKKEKSDLQEQISEARYSAEKDAAAMKKQFTIECQQLKKEKSDLQGEMKKAESVAQHKEWKVKQQLMYLEEQISKARYSAAAMKKQFTIECQQLKKEKSDLQADGKMKTEHLVRELKSKSDKDTVTMKKKMDQCTREKQQLEEEKSDLQEAMKKAEHLAQQVTSENEMIAEKQKQQLICLKSKLEAAESLAQQTKSDKERMVEELKEKGELYKRECQQLEENYRDLKASCSTVLQQNGEMFLRMESDIGNAKQRTEQSYLQMNPGASDMSSMRVHRSRSEPPRFHDQQGGDFRTSEQGGGVSRSPILSGSPRSLHRTSMNRSQKASSLSLPGMSSMAISEQQEWNGQSTWDHHPGTDTWPRRHAAEIAPQSMPHPMEAFEQQGMPRTCSLSSLPGQVQGPNRALKLSHLMPYVPELAPVRSAIAGYLDMHTQWLTLEQSNADRPRECLQKLFAQWLAGEEEEVERPHTWGYFIKLVKMKGIEKHQLADKVRRDQFQFIPHSDL